MPLKEIAKNLNISSATVSLVLHNRPGVSDETRTKVLQQLKDHGYHEELKEQEKETIRRVYLLKYSVVGYHTGKNDGFVNSMLDSIGQEARKLGYDVVVTPCHEGEFIKVLQLINENPLDGMILLGTDLPLFYKNYLEEFQSPVVTVDTKMPAFECDSVTIDNRQCIYKAVDLLCGYGHSRIGFIYSCFKTYNYKERYYSFMNIAEERGIKVDRSICFPVNPMMEGTYDNIVSIMQESGSMPDAVIADNDAVAVGMLNALSAKGYSIPDNISLVSIGDSLFCRMTSPAITAVQIPGEMIGETAMRVLNCRIENPNGTRCTVSVAGDVMMRESAARKGPRTDLPEK